MNMMGKKKGLIKRPMYMDRGLFIRYETDMKLF
jgi:hypothetical protein